MKTKTSKTPEHVKHYNHHLLFTSVAGKRGSIIIAFILLMFPFPSPGQPDYPNGTIWHYSQFYWGAPMGYATMEVIKDTVINSVSCKQINRIGNYGCDEAGYPAYIYSDSNKVYYYNGNLNGFFLLYDFNANVGDSWVAICSGSTSADSLVITVDSISWLMFNNDSLKVQYISYSATTQHWDLGTEIIEKIGGSFYFFLQSNLCDPMTGTLRCYTDSIIGHYETGIVGSCTQIGTGTADLIYDAKIQIYPNPANKFLNISTDIIYEKISIADIFGKEVLKAGNEQSINVSELEGGVYVLKFLNSRNSFLAMKKFIRD